MGRMAQTHAVRILYMTTLRSTCLHCECHMAYYTPQHTILWHWCSPEMTSKITQTRQIIPNRSVSISSKPRWPVLPNQLSMPYAKGSQAKHYYCRCNSWRTDQQDMYNYVELNWGNTENAELRVLTLSREYSAQDWLHWKCVRKRELPRYTLAPAMKWKTIKNFCKQARMCYH